MLLNIGDRAPDFSLPDANGNIISLSDFKNQRVVLWFFPKANTPGWTIEGRGFRDESNQFAEQNTAIIGCSADPPSKQKKFCDKQKFSYSMLCDESHSMLESYGVWGLKKFMGREYMGILRVTYVVDQDGKIKKVYNEVKTKTHSQDVLSDFV